MDNNSLSQDGNEKVYSCDCGFVSAGKFCTNCGKPHIMQVETPPVNRACDEKENLIAHGWRDGNGEFQLILKDGRMLSRCFVMSSTPQGILMPTVETLRIDTEYGFSAPDTTHMPELIHAIAKLDHPDEEFAVYPSDHSYRRRYQIVYEISKLWYGSGTLHMDLIGYGGSGRTTIDLISDDTVTIPAPEPEKTIGWTCTKCKAENQVGEKCEECGEEIKKEVLFSCSSYMTCMPPRTEGATVYAFSDSQLICEIYRDGTVKRRFIPAEVAKDAQEIIHANGIDKWRDYENVMNGMMGGSVSVRYREGDTLVGTSMDKMGSIILNAYHQLLELFSKE
ncbi:MAG: hypothetical protein J5752_00555 [Clostridiales bacterium]|nr:hypothetical protein [Clostridiales bacterium]